MNHLYTIRWTQSPTSSWTIPHTVKLSDSQAVQQQETSIEEELDNGNFDLANSVLAKFRNK